MAAGGVSDDFDVEAWNPEEVAKYFSEKGLQTFAELCEPNDIDGTVLINTSYDELRNLGLTFGIAKKVLLEIRKLKPCGSSISDDFQNLSLTELPMKRFEKLLKEGHVTPLEKVMRDVELYFASVVMVCSRKETAVDIYERAKQLPSPSTKRHFSTRCGITIDGPIQNGSGSQLLLNASKDNRPCVIKLLEKQNKSDDQVTRTTAAMSGSHPSESVYREILAVKTLALNDIEEGTIPLVPYKVVNFSTEDLSVISNTSTGCFVAMATYTALVAPLYYCSLDALAPIPDVHGLVRGGTRIQKALEYMHRKDLVHMDVKGANIMVDYKGEWWLGDFGSTVMVGKLVVETTKVCRLCPREHNVFSCKV